LQIEARGERREPLGLLFSGFAMAQSKIGMWLTLGFGAGALLLASCCFCGGIGGWFYYKLTVPPNIAGRWQNDFGGDVYEFRTTAPDNSSRRAPAFIHSSTSSSATPN